MHRFWPTFQHRLTYCCQFVTYECLITPCSRYLAQSARWLGFCSKSIEKNLPGRLRAYEMTTAKTRTKSINIPTKRTSKKNLDIRVEDLVVINSLGVRVGGCQNELISRLLCFYFIWKWFVCCFEGMQLCLALVFFIKNESTISKIVLRIAVCYHIF